MVFLSTTSSFLYFIEVDAKLNRLNCAIYRLYCEIKAQNMPAKKKQPKNAFYFFMLDVQEEVFRLTKRRPPMKDLPGIANPRWIVSSCNETRIRSGSETIDPI